ncbi:MAG: restriction endonuclease subunit S [Candidatus Thiodiazotropha sp. (ex Lucinoma borealis)]|nr:restriction endonuclease subunit S [Candidatus Thiodiazotropha sp. (ex Lucinoma borealis)]MCU7864473.1 restriction endonuclease subunit S [Candidatus Thiodiazotropha sp. (ex Lucinoma borealis)]
MSEVENIVIPDGWATSPLRDISEKLVDGSHNPPKKQDSGLPMLSARNIEDGLLNWEANYRLIAEDDFESENKRTNIEANDVLLTIVGTIGRACVVPKNAPRFTLQRSVAVIKPIEIDPKFICYQLQSSRVQNYLNRNAKGTAQKGIYLKALGQMDMLVAPIEQQKRIVAKIEELFSHIDAGIEALKKAKQLLKQYRQSVLKAAVTGELTKEWREANKDDAQGSANVAGGRTPGATKLEPASQLLERILKERREKWEEQQLEQFKAKDKMPKDDKWKEKYKEPLIPEFEHVNNIPEIPDTWEWVTVSQLTTLVKDGPHYSPKYAKNGIPFITGGNVRPNGVDFENCKFITEELHEELSKRCKPELNDILFTKGGTTGIARVNTYDFEFNVWVHVAVLRLVNMNSIDPFYMQHALNSQLCYAQSQKYTHGVGNQDLGLTRMIKICLAIPPLEEQREVIGIIDRKMESIARTEEQIEHMLIMGEKDKQSILASAFSGGLQ